MADRKTKSAPAAKPKRVSPLVRKAALRVSYQGEPGANSHLACREVFPDLEPHGLRDLRGRAGGGEERAMRATP